MVVQKIFVREIEEGQAEMTLFEFKEGKIVRRRMKDLKEASATALSENGYSTIALSKAATKWIEKTRI